MPQKRRSHTAAAATLAACLTSGAAHAAGPAPVDLGNAGYFTILTKAGIADVAASHVTGNVGTSPITGAADHLSCTEVTGNVISVDKLGPAPCNKSRAPALTVAIGAMQTAYTDAAGRTPDVNNLGAGNIGGLTLAPGTYNWTTNLLIPTDVTLHGTAKDVWILQVAQNVTMAAAQHVFLTGGAKAKNVFWVVAGQVTIGTTSQFQGVILGQTQISLKTGASLVGRLYAQTAVTLEMNTVTKPHG